MVIFDPVYADLQKKEREGQKEISNVWFGEKRNTRKLSVTAKARAGREAVTVR